MNKVCKNHGGVAAYMDDGAVLSSAAFGNLTGLTVSSGSYSAAGGNVSVDAVSGIAGAPSSATVIAQMKKLMQVVF